jgi:hypothetical protein
MVVCPRCGAGNRGSVRLPGRERLQDVVPMLGDSEVTAIGPDYDLAVTHPAGYEVDMALLHQRVVSAVPNLDWHGYVRQSEAPRKPTGHELPAHSGHALSETLAARSIERSHTSFILEEPAIPLGASKELI